MSEPAESPTARVITLDRWYDVTRHERVYIDGRLVAEYDRPSPPPIVNRAARRRDAALKRRGLS